MQIIGYRKSDFTAKDGTAVKSFNIYLSEPITTGGEGMATDRIYLSEKKVADMGVDLTALVGKHVALAYNRWGKVAYINVLDK